MAVGTLDIIDLAEAREALNDTEVDTSDDTDAPAAALVQDLRERGQGSFIIGSAPPGRDTAVHGESGSGRALPGLRAASSSQRRARAGSSRRWAYVARQI